MSRKSESTTKADATKRNEELGDEDLGKVAGGLTCRKAGKDQQEFAVSGDGTPAGKALIIVVC